MIDWNKHVDACAIRSQETFNEIAKERNLEELNLDDLLIRIIKWYILWLKLIHHKKPIYFKGLEELNHLAPTFAALDGPKRLYPFAYKRVDEGIREKLDKEEMRYIALWVALKYNLWLAEEL